MDEPRTLRVPGRLLRAAGVALFGETWQLSLSRLLNVQGRTIQRWEEAAKADRDYLVSVSLIAEIMGHLERKSGSLMRAHDTLKELYDGR